MNEDSNLSLTFLPHQLNVNAILVTLYWYGNFEVEGAVIVNDHDYNSLQNMEKEQAATLIVQSLAKRYQNSLNGDGRALFNLVKGYL
jgi:hypothetical protein